MAKLYLQNVSVTVGTVDLSSSVQSVEISLEADGLEVTNFGSGGWRERINGLKSGSVSINFFQDYAAAAVDASLYPLFGTVATVTVRPASGSASATNPQYAFPAQIAQYSPVAGAVGDIATFQVQWPLAGSVTKTP